jgi:mono/diheme cytochrome c family protein
MSLPPPSRSTQARPRRRAGLWPALSFYLLFFPCFRCVFAADLELKDQAHLRRPIAAVWIEPNKRLAVGNQKSGSISIVDFPSRQVIEEIQIGQRLTDLGLHKPTGWMLAIDDKLHELIVLRRSGESLVICNRIPVSPFPVSIAISPSGNRISVASLWSRKLTIFELSGNVVSSDGDLNRIAEITIAFNPQDHSFMASEDYITVKDAFARRFDAVSISERIKAKSIGVPAAPRLPDAAHDYGRTSRGEISKIIDGVEYYFHDAVKIALGPAPEPTPAERGENLFFDRALSGDGLISCHSCHNRGHTTYQLADTLGDETTGTPKRIPTLLGTRLTDPWAWNGKQRDLTEQVRKSLETTLHAKDFTPDQVGDIVAYLHTLEPPPPLQPASHDPEDKKQLAQGESLFQNLGCAKCHVPPLTYTSPEAYDVGLADEKGLTKFNPPSLRGVSQGYTLFHDGRAKSLGEVFTVHGHMLDRALSDAELADLLRFLSSL